jgi:AraC-like DNA-binding protein
MTGIPEIGVAFGFVGLSSIGPLLWLYISYSKGHQFQMNRIDALHFLFPVIGFFPVWLLGGWMPTYFYTTGTTFLFFYLMAAWLQFSKITYNQSISKYWNKLVLISVSLIWSAFVFQHLSEGILQYALGAALASLLMYVLLIYALKNPVLFPKNNKVRIDEKVIVKLRHAIEEDKVYQKPAITINQLAEELSEPSYILSKAMKLEFGKSFPELMNHYRIKDVKNSLSTFNDDFLKIEGLAYEVGFNTPSAFYAAFKKETSLSPKEFQKQVLSTEN